MLTWNSSARRWLLIGALFGGLSVAIGALGAHKLQSHLKGPNGILTAESERLLDNWETAARYQMYHALALLAVGGLAAFRPSTVIDIAGAAMTAGVLIFSGCLYALVLSGQKFLGAIVPIGGVLLLVGWGLLAIGVARRAISTDSAGR
jgi:uncharacterized membrane protein YgdD (TMEM256/DUF423 family)